MPLPDERPRQSVANLIGRFEQQGKKASASTAGSAPTPGPLPISRVFSQNQTSSTTNAKSNVAVNGDDSATNAESVKPAAVPKEATPIRKESQKSNDDVSKVEDTPKTSPTATKKVERKPTAPAISTPSKKPSVTSNASAPKTTATSQSKTPSASTTAAAARARSPRLKPQHTGGSASGSALKPQHTGGSSISKSRVPPSSFPIPASSTPPQRPKTPTSSTSRLYAPTAASLAKSNSEKDKEKSPPKRTGIPSSTRSTPARKPTAATPAATPKATPASAKKSPETVKPRVGLAVARSVKKPTGTPSKEGKSAPGSVTTKQVEAAAPKLPLVGKIVHLASTSQTDGVEDIENYDDDFPMTEEEEVEEAPEDGTQEPTIHSKELAERVQEPAAAHEETPPEPPSHEPKSVVQEAASEGDTQHTEVQEKEENYESELTHETKETDVAVNNTEQHDNSTVVEPQSHDETASEKVTEAVSNAHVPEEPHQDVAERKLVPNETSSEEPAEIDSSPLKAPAVEPPAPVSDDIQQHGSPKEPGTQLEDAVRMLEGTTHSHSTSGHNEIHEIPDED